jgi:hypothetical protein
MHYILDDRVVFSLTIVLGLLSTNILNYFGYITGEEGIKYYAEVHQSKLNSYIHTIFMPGTIYGISCWIPALFSIIFGNWFNEYHKLRLQKIVWLWYILHYITFAPLETFLTIILYTFPAYFAQEKIIILTEKDNYYLFIHGFMCMFICLIIQEIFGHWLCGDNPSRIEGVPNAILYAGIYPSWHIINGIP